MHENSVLSLHPDFLNELHKYSSGEFRDDLAARILCSTDASIYQIEPKGVVNLRRQEDLHAALELAAKYDVPVLPRGAGTTLAGQSIGCALILDCSRWLENLVKINPDEHFTVVEPGLVLSNLNKAARKSGLQYGPNPYYYLGDPEEAAKKAAAVANQAKSK